MQLPLGIGLREGPTFANFLSDAAPEAAAALRALAVTGGPGRIYLWGAPGCGRTHLLEAACREAARGGTPVVYVPLARAGEFEPGVLTGLEHLGLVCIDDLHAVAGDTPWEEAVFHLCNRSERGAAGLVVAGARAPAALELGLPDLASRLAAATVFHLRPLDEAGRCRAMQLRARERGFEIPDEVARYLLRRQPRDMHTLMGLVERLDRSTLAAQRRVTVPFVKRLLGV